MSNRFQLHEWQVLASENCIVRGEERVLLEPRVMDLLVFMSRNPGRTLGKDEILESVWGSLHHSDSVIARAISLLRQHLCDDVRNPVYIRTIPSRGYRLIAPVHPLPDEASLAPDGNAQEMPIEGAPAAGGVPRLADATPTVRYRHNRWGAAVALVLLLIAGALVLQRYGKEGRQESIPAAALANLSLVAIAPLADREVPEDLRYLTHDVHEAVADALLKRARYRVVMLPIQEEDDSVVGSAGYLALAKQRGADVVLLGTALWRPSGIDVELRLVVPHTREQLWRVALEQETGSEQSFRDGIVAAVTASLGGALEMPTGAAAFDAAVDPKAYRLQTQARWFLQRRSVEGVRKANELFKQATERDPAYADAFSGLASSFIHMIQYTGMPPEAAFAQAMAAAEQALELDPVHSEAITAKAQVLALRDWNFHAAIDLLRRALEFDPDDTAARQHLAEMQMVIGQYDAAVENIDRALAIKPYSALLLAVKALILTHAERYVEALDTLHQVDLLAPDFGWHYNYWAYALERTGKPIEAARLRASKHSFLAHLDEAAQQALQQAIGVEGPAALWRAIADHAAPFRGLGVPLYRCYDLEQLAARGREDKALALLKVVLEDRGEAFVMLQVSPALDRLRELPAYAELMRRHGESAGGFRPWHASP